ncbi:hepatic sodium/bile acid cotransporter-like [Brachyhypopomus gauderio]|uniref:hepatic sodium/bile acid cotransporter-like n=1 Tax=Brachyhypopomus gauderio TaxID=698409 RepID=UPI00404369C2
MKVKTTSTSCFLFSNFSQSPVFAETPAQRVQNGQPSKMDVTTSKTITAIVSFWNLNVTAPNSSANHTEPSPGSEAKAKAFRLIAMVTLLLAMVCMGCTVELSKIKAHILKPKGVVMAAVTQYGVMPLLAFSMAKLLRMRPAEAITVLVCGCCPGGYLSNILTLGVKGDTNLSVVMTTFSTLLALGAMPLLLYVYSQGFSGVAVAIPYAGIATALAMTTLPCAAGICIRHYAPQHARLFSRVGMSVALLTLIILGILVGVTVGEAIRTVTTPQLLVTAALMPLLGYILGYVLSSLFKLNQPSSRTVAMETGCQNLQLCFTILMMSFPTEFIGLLYLFPIVYVAFQVSEALAFILLFRCYERMKPPKETSV